MSLERSPKGWEGIHLPVVLTVREVSQVLAADVRVLAKPHRLLARARAFSVPRVDRNDAAVRLVHLRRVVPHALRPLDSAGQEVFLGPPSQSASPPRDASS